MSAALSDPVTLHVSTPVISHTANMNGIPSKARRTDRVLYVMP
jgi:hypothetical protein